jgi:hypothetical protein
MKALHIFLEHEFMFGAHATGTVVERRTAARYQLRAPVIFKSIEDEMAMPGAGFVKDISTEGVFVACPRPLPKGVSIEIEILLPPFETQDAKDDTKLVVRYIGAVVRSERDGFAVAAKVSLHRYNLRGQLPISDEEIL